MAMAVFLYIVSDVALYALILFFNFLKVVMSSQDGRYHIKMNVSASVHNIIFWSIFPITKQNVPITLIFTFYMPYQLQ